MTKTPEQRVAEFLTAYDTMCSSDPESEGPLVAFEKLRVELLAALTAAELPVVDRPTGPGWHNGQEHLSNASLTIEGRALLAAFLVKQRIQKQILDIIERRHVVRMTGLWCSDPIEKARLILAEMNLDAEEAFLRRGLK